MIVNKLFHRALFTVLSMSLLSTAVQAAEASALMREENLSATFYFYGDKHIKASEEYLQLALRFMPGWSIAAGMGMTQPEGFNYLMLDAHGNSLLSGGEIDCLPAFQIGLARYTVNDQLLQDRDGLLFGLSLSCPINTMASIDFSIKRLRDHSDTNQLYNFGSLGFRVNL